MMTFELVDLMPALPEIFVLTMACVVLLVDVFLSDENRIVSYLLTQATLLGATLLTVSLHGSNTQVAFSNMFISDSMSDVLKVFIYLVSAVAFLYSREYLRERQLFKGEYFILGLFAVLGMMIMASANTMLLIYLGLETLSLSLYAMVALNRDSEQSCEAAMKFFILGAIASGMLLYGMSMIYGVTGSLDLPAISMFIQESQDNNLVLVFGLTFIVIGLAFKLGAVPFHMWVPDVYHGAPTSVALFIGTAPKIAAFAMIFRLLMDGLAGLHVEWQDMLIILAVLSIAVGNIVAIAQTNMKRMLAYSSIAHVGFLLLGILTGTMEGNSAAMFYILVYALMSLGAFGMIILLSRNGFEADMLEDFRGLNERSPWFAFMMLILMFSMAGVPPTVGFYAKLLILRSVVDIGIIWLAVTAVVLSVIGAFYYLRIVKIMYFDRAEDNIPLTSPFDMNTIMSINGLAILALGIYPSALMTLCTLAIN